LCLSYFFIFVPLASWQGARFLTPPKVAGICIYTHLYRLHGGKKALGKAPVVKFLPA